MSEIADIDRLRAAFVSDLAQVANERDLTALRDRYLGRKGGVIASLMKTVSAAPAADRPRLGADANALKRDIEAMLEERRGSVAAKPALAPIDVTLPGRSHSLGRRHPLTALREQIAAIFTRWGYEVVDGPETEDDYHNFEALNLPPEHPARDMQDTLYLAEPFQRRLWSAGRTPEESGVATLLRTHTSPMQIRYMEKHRPPVRVIAPGRVYRRDNLDVTHTPMFQQVEGFVVGEGVTMADLKGTVVGFLRELFHPDTKVLFRPSFFPYTEPSGDVFIGCLSCGGPGCAVCKRTGWLEVLGCGMVHPAVFEAVNYDAERYTGFAFGAGVERIAMLRYGIDDIRMFYENDQRFLEQFPA